MADDDEPGRDRSKGGQGTHLSMAERLAVAQRVTAARLQTPALSWPKIAEREKVSETTVRKIYAEYRESVEITEDPTKAVDESLALYSYSIAKFAHEAEHAGNASARVGAARSMLEAVKGRLELMAATGKLPRRLGAIQESQDAAQLIMEFAKVVERHDLPSEIVEELLALVEGGQPEGKPILKLGQGD